MRELQPGLWWWESVHPEWTPELGGVADWGPEVSSYAIDDGARLLLIDPTAPPSPVDELAAEREAAIVLTCPWHARDARSLAERLGATLYAPPPDHGDPNPLDGHVFRADRLPVGVEALPGIELNDLCLDREPPRARRWRHADRPRAGRRVPGRLGEQGRGRRAGVPPEQILATLLPHDPANPDPMPLRELVVGQS